MHKPLALTMQAQPTEVTGGAPVWTQYIAIMGRRATLLPWLMKSLCLRAEERWRLFSAATHSKKGTKPLIHTYNLNVFDPTWFSPSSAIDKLISR